MIKTEELEEIIKMVLYSAYIKDEKPISLLIAAEVGAGKTELVKMYGKNKGLVSLTDTTAYGIIKTFLPELELGRLKHIILPDLITPLSKSKSTVKSFVSFLNNLIEEGIVEIQTYASSVKKEVSCGLIACIAKKELHDRRHSWAQMGFMSRVLPLSWSYSQVTVVDILNSIVSREYYKNRKIKLDFPKKSVKIKRNPELDEKLIPFSIALSKAEEVYGFRRQKQLQTLMMANALMNKRRKVTKEDFEKVKSLLKFVNLGYNVV